MHPVFVYIHCFQYFTHLVFALYLVHLALVYRLCYTIVEPFILVHNLWLVFVHPVLVQSLCHIFGATCILVHSLALYLTKKYVTGKVIPPYLAYPVSLCMVWCMYLCIFIAIYLVSPVVSAKYLYLVHSVSWCIILVLYLMMNFGSQFCYIFSIISGNLQLFP